MKKIIFTLLALVGTMSMNAQVIEVYKGNVLVAKYKSSQADNVVFKEEEPLGKTGKAYAKAPNCDVNWVQLWKDGPKFAEYNVGATSKTGYGGLYNWGMSNPQSSSNASIYQSGTFVLSGNDDTATNLWGSNWRMPTKEEFEALLNNQNCTCTWTTQNGVKGLLCKGKENTDYSSNSVFLPAAGYCIDGRVFGQGDLGYYWSSTPDGSNNAYYLDFLSGSQYVHNGRRNCGFSVRAVLNE